MRIRSGTLNQTLGAVALLLGALAVFANPHRGSTVASTRQGAG